MEEFRIVNIQTGSVYTDEGPINDLTTAFNWADDLNTGLDRDEWFVQGREWRWVD